MRLLIAVLTYLFLMLPLPLLAASKDDPLLTFIKVDQLEQRYTDQSEVATVLEAEGWVGYDLDKFWFKVDIERIENDTEEVELQALYSEALAPYWDLQVGWRKDIKPEPNRDWLVVGLNGLAPYFFEVNSSLFVGESGQLGLRLEAEYEMLFTQQLILSPEFEINFYSKNDRELEVGNGLSDIELGIRLRYEITREISPYIGVNWERKFGQSANFEQQYGGSDSDFQWLVGIQFWF